MVVLLALTMALTSIEQSCAQDQRTLDSLQARIAALEKRTERVENFHRRFTVGGYGEAVMSRMFYSDNYKRYTNADLYKDDDGFGQFDLPHVVIYMGYDFGHGWTMGTEIEFEHGGAETAVEIEEEETGEYETEEGCLSLEGVRSVKRFREIEVKYQDESFNEKVQKFSGFTAQIVQHEMDHLEGIII